MTDKYFFLLLDHSENNTRTMTIRTQSPNETRFTQGVYRSTIQLPTERTTRTTPPPKITSILLDKMRKKARVMSRIYLSSDFIISTEELVGRGGGQYTWVWRPTVRTN